MRRDDPTLSEPDAGEVNLRECGFRHETLFHSGEDGFLSGTVQFITDALDAEEPVLVAVDRGRIEILRDALPHVGEGVSFTDMHVLGGNPARIIPAWRAFLQGHAGSANRSWPDVEPLVGRVYPSAEQWSRRGLWLANQLCDLMQIRSTPAGSVVRVHMQLA